MMQIFVNFLSLITYSGIFKDVSIFRDQMSTGTPTIKMKSGKDKQAEDRG